MAQIGQEFKDVALQTVDTAGQKKVRSQRDELISALQGQAAGTAPSLAAAQMKATQDKSLAQQLAAAAASRGGNQAALQRQLAMNQQQAGAQNAQNAATLKLQEQQAAQANLGNTLNAQTSDLGASSTNYLNLGNAQLQSDTALEQAKIQAQTARENQGFIPRLMNRIGLKDGGSVDSSVEKAFTLKAADGFEGDTKLASELPIKSSAQEQSLASSLGQQAENANKNSVWEGIKAGALSLGKSALQNEMPEAFNAYNAYKQASSAISVPEVKRDINIIPSQISPIENKEDQMLMNAAMAAAAKDGGPIALKDGGDFVTAIMKQTQPKGYAKVLAARRNIK